MAGLQSFDRVGEPPEQLTAATGGEIGAWHAVTQEEEITHDPLVRGGSGFIDSRGNQRLHTQTQAELDEPGDGDAPSNDVPLDESPSPPPEAPEEVPTDPNRDT